MTAGKRFKRLVRARAQRTGESYASARRNLLRSRSKEHTMEEMREVELAGVRVDAALDPPNPYLDLKEKDGGRRLPVFIGAPEASSIGFALNGGTAPRPMTHDALKQMLDAIGGRPTQIVLGFVPEASTYTADVTVTMPDGTEQHFDWRPSDAVALAVRTAPRPRILVPATLLDAPPSKSKAGYAISCSCGGVLRFQESELTPAAGEPNHLIADGACPACGERVRVTFARPE